MCVCVCVYLFVCVHNYLHVYTCMYTLFQYLQRQVQEEVQSIQGMNVSNIILYIPLIWCIETVKNSALESDKNMLTEKLSKSESALRTCSSSSDCTYKLSQCEASLRDKTNKLWVKLSMKKHVLFSRSIMTTFTCVCQCCP